MKDEEFDQLISVVVPVHNEEMVLDSFHSRLTEVMQETNYRYEIFYVDDGSTDNSAEILARLRNADISVAIIELSRNFGKEVAMSAGLDHVEGDATIIIDADLQDPPELILKFLAEWRSGYDVVYGQRSNRRGESLTKRWTARAFYRVLSLLSDVEIPRDVGDFRLLSRRAVDALTELPERHRYMKGLYAWIGFPQKAVLYSRDPREAGKSAWSYWRLWTLAMEGITSFSTAPLKFATYIGMITSAASLLYGAYFIARTLFMGNPVPGYPSLVVIVLFLGGIQLVCLGVIGEYLGRTYQESKRRTLYFVKGYHPVRQQQSSVVDD